MDSTTPENVQLQLPSAFNAALRQTLGLTELASTTLWQLCTLNRFCGCFTSDKQIAAATYRQARNAMISLGLSPTDSLWCELHNDQLWGKNVSTVRKTHDPWFWQVVAP